MGAPVFDTSYERLPERFYARIRPSPVRAPKCLYLNTALAGRLGLDPDWLRTPEGLSMLAGNAVPEGSPFIAQAYAGHQFGGFVPQLGDGRAVLLGEILAPDGARFDVQLKGSGPTPFSRRGDGRAAIGPVLREVILSEAMAALGVPTTRALAALATGEAVLRDQILPGGVLTRIASSHIRVGTFEYFAARGDTEALSLLVRHALDRHDPDAADAERPALALIEGVVSRQADLVARWMGIGFIHGVMNTDNTAISGETIDYGPCAFLDEYDPAKVFSSIDREGRYAYANQPRILLWNLARMAEALIPLIDLDEERAVTLASDAVNAFPDRFRSAWRLVFAAKLGLDAPDETDDDLIMAFLTLLADSKTDFTLAFRALTEASSGSEAPLQALVGGERLENWLAVWRQRIGTPQQAQARMAAANPVRIPRNHQVERALKAAEAFDIAPFEALMAALAEPFRPDPALAAYETPPAPGEAVTRTFCGT